MKLSILHSCWVFHWDSRVRSLVILLSCGLLFMFLVGLKPVFADPPGGLPYKWDQVRIGGGGSVCGIVLHPLARDVRYIRTDVGDAYRWNPDKDRWQSITNWIPWYPSNDIRHGIESIAVDPSDSSGLTVWLSLGMYPAGIEGSPKGNVVVSRDGGRSFERTALRVDAGSNMDQTKGERLAVDPWNGNIVYYASREGLFRTIDGGKTWSSVQGAPKGRYSNEWRSSSGLQWIAIDKISGTTGKPLRSKVLYTGALGEGLFMSVDGGDSWTMISGLVGNRATVSGDGVLFVTAKDGVYRFSGGVLENVAPVEGGYVAVATNLVNPREVMVSRHHYGFHNQLYRSLDSGESWVLLDSSNMVFNNEVPWHDPNWSMASIFSLAFDPFNSGQVFFTTWYATWKTSRIDVDTIKWCSLVKGHEETVTIGAAVSPPSGPVYLYSGLADVGGFIHEDLDDWPVPYRNRGTHPHLSVTGCDQAENIPGTVVIVGRDHWDGPGLGYITRDHGNTFHAFEQVPGAGGRIAICPSGQAMVWVPQRERTYFSKDMGKTWKESTGVEGFSMGGHNIFSYNQPLAADRLENLTFYLLSKNTFFLSSNGGESWEKKYWFETEGEETTKVEAAPGIAGEVWVSLNKGGLFRSGDYGSTFHRIKSVSWAYSFSFGKAAKGSRFPSVFLYGTIEETTGIFRSDDMGKTWWEISDASNKIGNCPHVMTGDRQVHGRVFIGTAGSGFYRGEPRD